MEGSLHHLPARAPSEAPAGDLAPLEALCAALEAGAGVPEIVRTAARALDASLILIDPSSSVLAVATRSPSEEKALMTRGADVETVDLLIADEAVGQLRVRARSEAGVGATRLAIVRTLLASELARVRLPARASEEASAAFLRAVLDRTLTDREELIVR